MGYVATTTPLVVTVISSVLMLAVAMWDGPTVKLVLWLEVAHRPLPALNWLRSAVTPTCSRVGQYTSGRRWSSSLSNQYHPVATGMDSVTCMSARMAVWSAAETGWLKRSTTGSPTPTVSPVPGVMVYPSVSAGTSEAKWVTWTVALAPLARAASAVTV